MSIGEINCAQLPRSLRRDASKTFPKNATAAASSYAGRDNFTVYQHQVGSVAPMFVPETDIAPT